MDHLKMIKLQKNSSYIIQINQKNLPSNEYNKIHPSYLNDLLNIQSDNNKALLEDYHKAWNDTKLFLRWMKRIFSNLDKFYLKNIDTTIAYAGFKIFKDICFVRQAPRVVDLILKYLNQDREGEEIPRSLIKSCLNVSFDI